MISNMFLMSCLQSPSLFMNLTYRIRLYTGFVIPWATLYVPHVEMDLLPLPMHLRSTPFCGVFSFLCCVLCTTIYILSFANYPIKYIKDWLYDCAQTANIILDKWNISCYHLYSGREIYISRVTSILSRLFLYVLYITWESFLILLTPASTCLDQNHTTNIFDNDQCWSVQWKYEIIKGKSFSWCCQGC